MNLQLLIPAFIAATVAVCGWYIAHRSSVRRDQKAKKREIRIKYLIDAYRKIEMGSARMMGGIDPYLDDVAGAIADIQLFGTDRQIELAQKFANEMSKTQRSSTAELLEALRDDLREELELEKSNREVIFMRLIDVTDKKRVSYIIRQKDE